MMSVIALSLPEMVILRKVLKMRLIATFVGVVASGILLVGFVFNAVLDLTRHHPEIVHHESMDIKVLGTGCANCRNTIAADRAGGAGQGRRRSRWRRSKSCATS